MASKHGRNTVLAIKKYGESTYTAVAQLEDYAGGGWTRAVVVADGYNSPAISKLFDPALDLKPITIKGRLDSAEATHDEATGLEKWSITNEPTTWEIRGPNYSAPTTDVLQCSGQVSDFTFVTPKDDAWRFECVLTPDGSHLALNGVTVVSQTV